MSPLPSESLLPSELLFPEAAPVVSPEEVYGPDYPLTQDDVPVLENGICRVRFQQAERVFALDSWVDGAYVEQGRVLVMLDFPAGTEIQIIDLIQPMVLEWTPERAVIGATFRIGPPNRYTLYITLQRGWSAPRFELYGSWAAAGKPGLALRLVPFAAGATTLGRSSSTTAIVDGTDYGTLAALEPWLYLLGQSPNLALHVAVLQAAVKVIGRSDSAAYGAARNGVSVAAQTGSSVAGYVSATFGIGARASAGADAQNLGRTNLIDARSQPLLVERR